MHRLATLAHDFTSAPLGAQTVDALLMAATTNTTVTLTGAQADELLRALGAKL